MSDYTVGMIQFENNKAGKLMSAIQEMEKDRCAGWEAFFKADYERDELKKENKRLSKLVEKLLCRPKVCRKSTKR